MNLTEIVYNEYRPLNHEVCNVRVLLKINGRDAQIKFGRALDDNKKAARAFIENIHLNPSDMYYYEDQ